MAPFVTQTKKSRRKICRFCADRDIRFDYKETKMLGHFLTEDGKILPRRITGNCAFHQRGMTQAIKRSRLIALLPFSTSH
jgi:small subunit ribosomal protein S18